MSEPTVSIVIPSHNPGPLLRRCLDSLQHQVTEFSYEVLVVDDGSTDNSNSDASQFQSVRHVRQKRSGASVARNLGASQARGSVVLFLDADCAPHSDWIQELATPLLRGVAAVTVGRFVSRQEAFLARLIQCELEGRFQRMLNNQRIDFLNSATCGFQKDLIVAHPFDPEFLKLEDVELSFRLARLGIPVQYVHNAVVEHHHPTSLRAYLGRKFRYGRTSPRLYRRFPERSLQDGSTPVSRRIQLALLLIACLLLPFYPLLTLLSLLLSIALGFPVARKAWSYSIPLALSYPLFSLVGNVVFFAGVVAGVFSMRPARDRPSPPIQPCGDRGPGE